MMNRKHLRGAIMFLVGIFSISFVMANNVFAADQQSIKSKAMFEGVYQCFNTNKAFAGQFLASNPQKFVINNGRSDSVKLPYGWTSASNNDLTCYEAMFDGKNGLIPTSAQSGYNITAVKNYFAGTTTDNNGMVTVGSGAVMDGTTTGGIGYKSEDVRENSGTGKQVVYSVSSASCESGESNPTLNGKSTITFPAVAQTDSGLYVINGGYDVPAPGSNDTKGFATCGGATMFIQDNSWGNEYIYTVIEPDGMTVSVSYSSNKNGIGVVAPNISINNGRSNVSLSATTSDVKTGSGSIATDYKLTWGGGDAMALLRGLNASNKAGYKLPALSAGMGYANLMLTKQEVFDLYVHYIQNVFKAKLVVEGGSDYEGIDVNLCSTKKYKVNATGANQSLSGVYGVDSNYHFTATVDLNGVINTLNTLGPFDDINNGGRCETSADPDNNSGGGGSTVNPDELDCDSMVNTATDGEGIGATQWILCPAMNNTRYTASWVDEMTDDWLSLPNSAIYGSGGETEQVWSVVRNIANVLMIVFLLLIIFSQLTGYGIDNYGIKKMLPRLIVMAIIVNLSFYICQIAVDLSNIFGVGLRNMFASLSSMAGNDAIRGTNFLGGMITGLFATAGGASTAMGAATLVAGLGAPIVVAVVIAVIVLCLVILVAVVTLFLMLGLRQIIVIMCIVLAPLAFAAFILPNTQSMFKKWWDLFKAALIIYPICGAVGGISYLLRSMAANGLELSVWGYAVMMILPYLVFFLLPTLLNTAIAALGKAGGALSRMGSNIKSSGRAIGQGAMKMGQNTEAFKNLQSEAARQRQQRNAQRVVDNVNKKEAGGGVLNDRDKMRRLNAQQTLNRLKQEQHMADLGTPVLSDDTAHARAEAVRESQEIKNYMDQYTGFTRPKMTDELDDAVVAYANDRSVDNATRLQAALMHADNENMNKEMLFGKLSGLNLNAADQNDAKVLKRLSGSKDVVLSQYGKALSKNAGATMNLNNFAAAASDKNTKLSLTDALADKGSNVLVGANDDTLGYLAQNAANAASSEMLINAAGATTNEKELTQINNMLGSPNRNDVTFSPEQLAKMKAGSLNAIKGKFAVKGSQAHQEFMEITNKIADDPRLLTSLNKQQMEIFNEIRGDKKFQVSSGSSGSKFVVGFH